MVSGPDPLASPRRWKEANDAETEERRGVLNPCRPRSGRRSRNSADDRRGAGGRRGDHVQHAGVPCSTGTACRVRRVQDHYSFFPMSSSGRAAPRRARFARDGKGTISFEYGRPLPTAPREEGGSDAPGRGDRKASQAEVAKAVRSAVHQRQELRRRVPVADRHARVDGRRNDPPLSRSASPSRSASRSTGPRCRRGPCRPRVRRNLPDRPLRCERSFRKRRRSDTRPAGSRTPPVRRRRSNASASGRGPLRSGCGRMTRRASPRSDRSSGRSGDAGEANSTFPLWMYVATSANPFCSKHALSSGILIRFFPPTLIPRSSAT